MLPKASVELAVLVVHRTEFSAEQVHLSKAVLVAKPKLLDHWVSVEHKPLDARGTVHQ